MMSEWRDAAACKNQTDVMFDQRSDLVARAVCARCDVARPCLAYALELKPEAGIWAGLDPLELALFPRRRRRRPPPRPRRPPSNPLDRALLELIAEHGPFTAETVPLPVLIGSVMQTTERTIRNSLRRLEAAGYIRTTRNSKHAPIHLIELTQ